NATTTLAAHADIDSASIAPIKTDTGASHHSDMASDSADKAEATGTDATRATMGTAAADDTSTSSGATASAGSTERVSTLEVERAINDVAKAAAQAWLDVVKPVDKAESTPARSDLALRGAQEVHTAEPGIAAKLKSEP